MNRFMVLSLLFVITFLLASCSVGNVQISVESPDTTPSHNILENFAISHAQEAIARIVDNSEIELAIVEMHWFTKDYHAESDERFLDILRVYYYVVVEGDEAIDDFIVSHAYGENELGEHNHWQFIPSFIYDGPRDLRLNIIDFYGDTKEVNYDTILDLEYEYGTFNEDDITAWLND